MDLVLETGVGVTNANSWVDLAYADDYHASLGNKQWITAAPQEGDRTALLLKAMVNIIIPRYAGRWVGDIYSESQSLPWPRKWYYDNDERWIIGPHIPDEVKWLQCEVALNLIDNPEYDTPLRRGVTIQSVKVGPIVETSQFDSSQNPVLTAPKVARLARALLDASRGRVNVVRS